jgi:succinate-semialdehyde dehydrogenase / glutarate-semialdehyde dehydrogenase
LTILDRDLFIDGNWRPAASQGRVAVLDPATRGKAGTTAIADATDVEIAVTAAQRSDWAGWSADRRARILHETANLVEERLETIAPLLTQEQGKPLPDSKREIGFAAEVLRYYAEEGRRIWGSLRPSARGDVKSIVSYAPIGPAGVIVPWNYPVDIYAWKVAPALAAGCPVIAKPPLDAPLAIAELVRAFADAGLPAGALADLPGGPQVGTVLVTHPAIRVVAATVSTETGRNIMTACAPTLKRVALELGGQTPFIVLDDADLEEAATAAVRRSFSNMGQICIAVNRVLVHESRRSEFVEALVERTRTLRIGNGLEEGIEYGPVFNDAVRQKSRAHVEDALTRGARLLTGNQTLTEPPYNEGFFLAPAVLDNVPRDARVMNEETFGPVLPVAHARTDKELLALANASPYGLAAYVYSRDLERAWAFADRLESGGVGINVNDVTELQAPFGGWKLSGSGRDLGPEGLHTFLHTRHIRARVRPLP